MAATTHATNRDGTKACVATLSMAGLGRQSPGSNSLAGNMLVWQSVVAPAVASYTATIVWQRCH